MTILTRHSSILPWSFPFNTHELKPGQSVRFTETKAEGDYIWEITVTGPDQVHTLHSHPYPPEHTYSTAEKDQINGFGPEDRNWRWIKDQPSKESK
jgi:hypothetical protein